MLWRIELLWLSLALEKVAKIYLYLNDYIRLIDLRVLYIQMGSGKAS